MNIIGKWNVVKIAVLDEDFNLKMVTADELNAMPENPEMEEYKTLTSAVIEFTPDNKVLTLVPIPADQLEEAKKEGIAITDDGYCVMDQTDWKEENGKYFYNTGNQGTVLEEEIDPYMPLEVDEEGCMLFSGGLMLLKKA